MKYMMMLAGREGTKYFELEDIGILVKKIRDEVGLNVRFMIMIDYSDSDYIRSRIIENNLDLRGRVDEGHLWLYDKNGKLTVILHDEDLDAREVFCGIDFQVLIMPDRFANYYYLRTRIRGNLDVSAKMRKLSI